MKKQYKWLRWKDDFVLICAIFIACLVFSLCTLASKNTNNTLWACCGVAISTLIYGLIVGILSYLGILSIIKIDEEGISQKRRGKRYELKWREIVDCRCKRYIRTRAGYTGFIMEFLGGEQKISFEVNECRILKLLAICTNKELREKIEKVYTETYKPLPKNK